MRDSWGRLPDVPEQRHLLERFVLGLEQLRRPL
jgi:hypothetical protein